MALYNEQCLETEMYHKFSDVACPNREEFRLSGKHTYVETDTHGNSVANARKLFNSWLNVHTPICM
jgi:hypothetical protein